MIKTCPRCGGLGLERGSDHWGSYESCFLCGHVIEQVLAVAGPMEAPPDPPGVVRQERYARAPTSGLRVRSLEATDLADVVCEGGHRLIKRRQDIDQPCSWGVGRWPCGKRVRLEG